MKTHQYINNQSIHVLISAFAKAWEHDVKATLGAYLSRNFEETPREDMKPPRLGWNQKSAEHQDHLLRLLVYRVPFIFASSSCARSLEPNRICVLIDMSSTSGCTFTSSCESTSAFTSQLSPRVLVQLHQLPTSALHVPLIMRGARRPHQR